MARRGSVTIRETTFTLSGVDTIEKALDGMADAANRGPILERVHEVGGEVLADGMRERSPSSHIAENIVTEYTPGDARTAETKIGPARVDVVIGGRKVFLQALAYWFEFGTRAHTIVARYFKTQGKGRGKRGQRTGGARALTAGAGFYKSVQHPGTAARSFVRLTLDLDSEKALRAMGAEAWDQITRAAKKTGG